MPIPGITHIHDQEIVMSYSVRTRRVLSLVLMVAMPGVALAHPGHGAEQGGLVAGLTHPWMGLDHLLAMIAIGLWSLVQAPAVRSATPWLALAGMILGASLAATGVTLPGVESAIALSVLLGGILVASLARLPTSLAMGLVVAFMVFHGHAHGSEMPAGSSLVAFFIGFAISTLVITWGARRLGGWLGASGNPVLRVAGAAIAACGAFFVMS